MQVLWNLRQNLEKILRGVGGIVYHSELPRRKVSKGNISNTMVHGGVVLDFKVIADFATAPDEPEKTPVRSARYAAPCCSTLSLPRLGGQFRMRKLARNSDYRDQEEQQPDQRQAVKRSARAGGNGLHRHM